jgi:hypothetical protein
MQYQLAAAWEFFRILYDYDYITTLRRQQEQLIQNHEYAYVRNTGYTQKNGAISKFSKQFISHPTRAQHTLSAAGTVQVSHALPAVRFSCLLRGRGTSFHDGVAAGEGFLCASF